MDWMIRGALVPLVASIVVSLAIPASAMATETGDHRALFDKLEKTDVVKEGGNQPKSIVYVFFDANCYYCHLTWKALQPYEKAGLQVRWVPVAYQKPSSMGRAAAIMRAMDRAAALQMNETTYKADQFDGGIRPLENVPAALSEQIKANTELMRTAGAPGTPALVWKDSSGAVRLKVGVPRQSELPKITGLPLLRNDDPELAQFR